MFCHFCTFERYVLGTAKIAGNEPKFLNVIIICLCRRHGNNEHLHVYSIKLIKKKCTFSPHKFSFVPGRFMTFLAFYFISNNWPNSAGKPNNQSFNSLKTCCVFLGKSTLPSISVFGFQYWKSLQNRIRIKSFQTLNVLIRWFIHSLNIVCLHDTNIFRNQQSIYIPSIHVKMRM